MRPRPPCPWQGGRASPNAGAMRLWLASLLLLVFAAAPLSGASAQVVRAPGVDEAELDRRAQLLMQQLEMTGMAMAIVEDGEITLAKGYGERLRDSNLQVDENTVFRWASVSKSVAAAVLLGLVEDGSVDPNKSITELAPSLRLPPTEVRHDIVDLLSHRIGVTRNAYDTRIEGGRAAKTIRGQIAELGWICPPATCHTYQNVIYDSAAEIVERGEGLPYKTVVQRDVFDPLGMDTASVTLEGLTGSSNYAAPHGRFGERIKRVKPTYYRVPAAAGVNSSVVDLAKWMIALMPGEGSPFPEERLAAMQSPIVRTVREQRFLNRRFGDLKNSHYGLGLRVYDYHGHKVVGHRGGVQGYRALMLFDPERRSGIVMLWNSPHTRPIGLQMEFLDQLYGLPKRDWLRLNERS